MDPVIGIDLGTTSSRVAVLCDGKAIIVENLEGDGTTPSHVAITNNGRRLVGKPARRYALKDPKNVVFAVKRVIGRRFDDPIVQRLIPLMPYTITKAVNGNAWIKLQDQNYAPEQITAFTLQKLKQTAEAYFGKPISHAIIAVPAYFNDLQRQATKNAAKIAGLNVLRLYAEPTMAALAYGFSRQKDETIVVYDLGGGTFDVSIIKVDGTGVFEVLSTSGDMLLGGEDFDIILAKYLASEYQKIADIDLMKDPIARQRLKEAAELAKISLSTEYTVDIDLPFITTDGREARHLNMTITRSLFEDLIRDLINRSIEVCKKAVNDAGIKTNDFDRIVLVGGSTRIPLVQDSLERYFGKTPYGGMRREDSVALGAAIEGGVLSGEIKDALLLDVIPFSIGIETLGGVMTKIIERNTTIPTKKSLIFSTATDNQTVVSIHVLQGEQEMAAANETLGRFELAGIPTAPKGKPQIEVTFDIDPNSIVHVSAKDLATNKEQTILVAASGGLTETEILSFCKAAQDRFEQQEDATDPNCFPLNEPQARSTAIEASFDTIGLNNLKQPSGPKKIFISYAHEDRKWALAIQKALSLLARKNVAKIWIDRMIPTGDYWEEAIYSEIEHSTDAILVMSQDFLSSDFIIRNELPRIFAEKERRYLRIIPVMVRSCPYDLHEEVAKFQFFNDPERPLSSLKDWEVERELTNLARRLANEGLESDAKPRRTNSTLSSASE